jgi:predicted nucleic acid-binding protein
MSRVTDIVVDTNVWAHSQNPQEMRFANCQRFVQELRASHIKLCLDPEFNPFENNTSLIGAEYIDVLRIGSVAFATVVELLLAGRVHEVTTRVRPEMNRKVVQLIRDQRDRTFIRVTVNSDSSVFVCHDFQGGLQQSRRGRIEAELSIQVIDAAAAAELVGA